MRYLSGAANIHRQSIKFFNPGHLGAKISSVTGLHPDPMVVAPLCMLFRHHLFLDLVARES